MKVYRFMSNAEYYRYISGELLENQADHASHARTSSRGFCFLAEEEFGDINYNAWDFLSGIVSGDVCVELKIPESELHESFGTYASPCGGFFDTVQLPEWYAETYSTKNAELIRVARRSSLWGDWVWCRPDSVYIADKWDEYEDM